MLAALFQVVDCASSVTFEHHETRAPPPYTGYTGDLAILPPAKTSSSLPKEDVELPLAERDVVDDH